MTLAQKKNLYLFDKNRGTNIRITLLKIKFVHYE